MRKRPISDGAAVHMVALLTATLLLHASLVRAQHAPSSAAEAVAEDALTATIAALDTRYFDAYNGCELEILDDLHTDDLEAYHDLGGGPVGWETVREGLERGVCANPGRFRRELVPGTLKVFPIRGFGAVQLADHRFYEVQDNGEARLADAARMIILWRRVDGDWKVSRLISYDHRPATSSSGPGSSSDAPDPQGKAGAAAGPGVVHVAAPTGVRETDRASILAALARAEAGDTIRFDDHRRRSEPAPSRHGYDHRGQPDPRVTT